MRRRGLERKRERELDGLEGDVGMRDGGGEGEEATGEEDARVRRERDKKKARTPLAEEGQDERGQENTRERKKGKLLRYS